MIRNSGAHYIVHRNPSLVPTSSHSNAVYLHMQYGVHRLVFIFVNLRFGVWLLVRCFLNPLQNFRIVSIFYRQYNLLCRKTMALSERNTKGKIYGSYKKPRLLTIHTSHVSSFRTARKWDTICTTSPGSLG